jgi:hypothetical protein
MTPIAPSPAADKAQYLARFIVDHAVDGAEVTVIARSCDSPVALALASARDAIESKNGCMRAVVMQALPLGWGGDTPIDVRVALNPRLQDAHEQLVVGDAAVWIGDCMRRDPAKRDAYQQEKVACPVTSQFAALSFERLWAIATPPVGPVALGSVPAVPQRRDGAC